MDRAPLTSAAQPSYGTTARGGRKLPVRPNAGWFRKQPRATNSPALHPAGSPAMDSTLSRSGLGKPAQARADVARSDRKDIHPLSKDRTAKFLYHMLNPASRTTQAVFYRGFTAFLIIGNVLLFILASFVSFGPGFANFCDISDAATSCVFLVDYVARVYRAPLQHSLRQYGSCEARMRYCVSGAALVDALATFPFFIDLLVPGTEFISFAWVRIFRMFLLFRTNQLASAVRTCLRVLWVNRQILTVSMVLVFFMLLLTSSLLWAVASEEERERNDMKNVVSAMFLALLMLTGQGTPDPPMSWQLQLVVAVTACLSVPFFAVPAAMLTWGFEGEAARLAATEHLRRDRERVYGKDEDLCSSSSSDDDDMLEEYLDGLAGDDEVDEDIQNRALAFFANPENKFKQNRELVRSAKDFFTGNLAAEEERKQCQHVLKQDALSLLRSAAVPLDTGYDGEDDEEAELGEKMQKFVQFVEQHVDAVPRAVEEEPKAAPEAAADVSAVVAEMRALRSELSKSATAADVQALRDEVAALREQIARQS
eukprot:TRINITY_DN6054_c3_g1_i1.p1 TRINITY_DN6054_c3_g1~~TRINITY_DN6054_c3_g1_i1.p1  ORF type:complete len:539 (+),score=182.33 TRINITY_DN6054_c3_g1_i1:63-1679(+)